MRLKKTFLKKFHFYPVDIIQKITFATINQLYIHTIFPVILFKIQNSLIYYYNTNILLNKFQKSFIHLKNMILNFLFNVLIQKQL